MKFLIILSLTILFTWSVTSAFGQTGGTNKGYGGGPYGYNPNGPGYGYNPNGYGYNPNGPGYGYNPNGYGYNKNGYGNTPTSQNRTSNGRVNGGVSGGLGGSFGLGGGASGKRPNANTPAIATTEEAVAEETTTEEATTELVTTEEAVAEETTTEEATTELVTTELVTTEEIPTTTEKPYCVQYPKMNSLLAGIKTDETFPNGTITFFYECYGTKNYYTGAGIGYQQAKPPNKAKCTPARYVGSRGDITVEDGKITNYRLSCNVLYSGVVVNDRVTKSSLDFDNKMVRCDEYQAMASIQVIEEDGEFQEIKIDCQPIKKPE